MFEAVVRYPNGEVDVELRTDEEIDNLVDNGCSILGVRLYEA
jgi:hypothetical protein